MRISKNVFTTVTISNADPAVFTCVDHNLAPGDRIRLETTGALPTGLSTETDYYVIYQGYTADTFQVSASDSRENEDAEPKATTAAGSGTHTFIKMNRARFHPNVEDTR